MKFFMTGHALDSYLQLRRYELFSHLFPDTSQILDTETSGITHNLLVRVFTNTDTRLAAAKTVNPGFLLAGLLWMPLVRLVEDYKSNSLAEMEAIALASDAVISRQVKGMSMPRRFTHTAREIWGLQSRLKHRQGKRPFRLASHPRFRAAYDFLLLRAEAGEDVRELAGWWTDFIAANGNLPTEHDVKPDRPASRRRGRRRGAGRH